VMAFPDIVAYHHKPSEAKGEVFKDAIRQGKMDYSVASHPLFELVKCLRRVKERPFFLRALFRLYGFTWSAIKGDSIAVSAEIANYLRQEQLVKIMMYIHRQHK